MAYQSWSVVFGEQPSAAKWNILGTNDAHFYSFLGDNTAWQTWTPTFANFTKGSATIDAKYLQIAKTVNFRLNITLSGSTMGSNPTFTLPVTAVTHTTRYPIANGQITDATGNTSVAYAQYATTTTAQMRYYNAAANGDGITSTIPFTWADSDQLSYNGTYEAA